MNNIIVPLSLKFACCGLLALLLFACSAPALPPPVEPLNEASLFATGQTLYAVNCARCHGEKLQGQPGWEDTNADGTWKAPPLDGSGHTWHHSDSYIRDRILTGTNGPFASMRRLSDMPAFGDTLSTQETLVLIEFIKSQWTPDVREMQSQRQ